MSYCLKCGRELTYDEIAVYKKMVSRISAEFMCKICLAERFDLSVEFIDKKLAGVEVFLEEFVAKISADKLQEMNSLLDVVTDAMKDMRV